MCKAQLTVTDTSIKKDEPLEQVYNFVKAYMFIYSIYCCALHTIIRLKETCFAFPNDSLLRDTAIRANH